MGVIENNLSIDEKGFEEHCRKMSLYNDNKAKARVGVIASQIIGLALAGQVDKRFLYSENAVKGADALSILGCNVTVPYKSDVIHFLNGIDPLAEKIGAVNTLVRNPDGGYKGYNTDMLGLERALDLVGIKIQGVPSVNASLSGLISRLR